MKSRQRAVSTSGWTYNLFTLVSPRLAHCQTHGEEDWENDDHNRASVD